MRKLSPSLFITIILTSSTSVLLSLFVFCLYCLLLKKKYEIHGSQITYNLSLASFLLALGFILVTHRQDDKDLLDHQFCKIQVPCSPFTYL